MRFSPRTSMTTTATAQTPASPIRAQGGNIAGTSSSAKITNPAAMANGGHSAGHTRSNSSAARAKARLRRRT